LKRQKRDIRQLLLPIENWTPEELRQRKDEELMKLREHLQRKHPKRLLEATAESLRREA
jgi:hypothetical protein